MAESEIVSLNAPVGVVGIKIVVGIPVSGVVRRNFEADPGIPEEDPPGTFFLVFVIKGRRRG